VPEDAIGREIRQLRSDIKEDLGEIRRDLLGLVSREVHDAQLGRISDRVSNVERDLDKLVNAIEADRKAGVERRAADRRMVIGAMLAAGLAIVVDLVSATGVTP
jgi:hypothetical protein